MLSAGGGVEAVGATAHAFAHKRAVIPLCGHRSRKLVGGEEVGEAAAELAVFVYSANETGRMWRPVRKVSDVADIPWAMVPKGETV